MQHDDLELPGLSRRTDRKVPTTRADACPSERQHVNPTRLCVHPGEQWYAQHSRRCTVLGTPARVAATRGSGTKIESSHGRGMPPQADSSIVQSQPRDIRRPGVFLDLCMEGETCSKHRVARIMRANDIQALPGFRTRRYTSGMPAELILDQVKCRFDVLKANRIRVTNITCIRTREGWG